MTRGIYLAASGMVAQWMKLQAISNNISNSNTPAYKRDIIRFHDLLEASRSQPQLLLALSRSSSPYLSSLQDYPLGSHVIDFSEGELKRTGNSLDLALKGEGFFVVSTPNGQRYTRCGVFTLSARGELQTLDGFPVLGVNGPITIQGSKIEVSSSGEVKVDGKVVGTLKIVDFQKPYRLLKEGNNLFLPSDVNVRELPAKAEVLQGYIELPNVNPVKQMVELINTLRSFQIYQKTIQTFDDNFGKLLDVVGR